MIRPLVAFLDEGSHKLRAILQPTGNSDANKHFVDTILNPVPVAQILSQIETDDSARLRATFGNRESIPTWGVTAGKNGVNVKKWDRIQAGDLALFSRDNKVFASSFVADKIHAPKLALNLWQTNSEGYTWEYIYFLDDLAPLDVTYQAFNKIIGYKDSYVIQGFNVLNADKSLLLSEQLQLISSRYQPDHSVADYQKQLKDRLADTQTTDGQRLAVTRLEQAAIRRSLFNGDNEGICCICGKRFSVDFLFASHIKKRAACSIEERLDFLNVAAPMCSAGCDTLFERGYITVSESGTIVKGPLGATSIGVSELVDSVVGRTCPVWSSQREIYFKWHRLSFSIDG